MAKTVNILDYEEIARNVVRILKSERPSDAPDARGESDAPSTADAPGMPHAGEVRAPIDFPFPKPRHDMRPDAPHPEPGRGIRPDGPHPEPRKQPPVLLLHDENRRRQRVTLEPEALAEALECRGLASATRAMETAPAEVKVVASLLLDVPVALSGEARPHRERVGFDNPLLVGERFEALARRLGIEPERLHAELEGAPAEMLAIAMLLADGPCRDEGPDPDESHPVDNTDPECVPPADPRTPAAHDAGPDARIAGPLPTPPAFPDAPAPGIGADVEEA